MRCRVCSHSRRRSTSSPLPLTPNDIMVRDWRHIRTHSFTAHPCLQDKRKSAAAVDEGPPLLPALFGLRKRNVLANMNVGTAWFCATIITAAQGPRKNSFKKALKVSAPLPAAPVAPAESKKSKPKRRCSLPSSDEESPSNPMIQKPAAPVAPEVTDAIAKPREHIAVLEDSQISTQPQFVAAAVSEEQDATPEPPSKALTRADTEQTIPVR